MKKLSYLLSLLVVLGIAFSSCEEEVEPNAPTISVSPTETSVNAGDTAVFAVQVSSNSELLTLVWSVTKGSLTAENGSYVFESGVHSESVDVMIVVAADLQNDDVLDVSFTISDQDLTSDASAKINVVVVAPPTVLSFPGVSLETGLAEGTAVDMLATATAEDYAFDDVTGNDIPLIDIMYFYGDPTWKALGPVFASPDDIPVDGTITLHNGTALANANTTKFTVVTGIDFDNLTSADLDALTGIIESRVSGFGVGDFVAFETAAGKIGIIKVTAINGTYNQYDSIDFDYKVQE